MADHGAPSPRREAVMVWLKFLGLLALVFSFGAFVLMLRRLI